jgi:hypothetical protein
LSFVKILLDDSVFYSPFVIKMTYEAVKAKLRSSSKKMFNNKDINEWLKFLDNSSTSTKLFNFFLKKDIIYRQDDQFKLVSDMVQPTVAVTSPAEGIHPHQRHVNFNKFLPVNMLLPLLRFVYQKVDEHAEITSLTTGNFTHQMNHFCLKLEPLNGFVTIR